MSSLLDVWLRCKSEDKITVLCAVLLPSFRLIAVSGLTSYGSLLPFDSHPPANVDWALLNFMKDWFPVEAKKKLQQSEREAAEEQLEELGFKGQSCIIV